ncbi:hypothetical protein FP2506_09976 [Fulvimarina pelagi HTCC2506]|uniref:Plasmid stabilization system n=1 Tax=Fulvimarina pelagi HTCC2506 TaxID=314231 RepID=Q0G5A1_9HYPH|nr:type II toxin-antitoxin system RelE/ParE family toxin [Fulvimarina pelagi]EAU43163.1 hypothetical protein FP2506_09976 [Fulvimarina pelagi HTCC2506]
MRTLAVRLSEQAIRDLTEIGRFIADLSGSTDVALGFTDRIKARCMKIGNAPRGGVARSDLGEGIRLVPFERSTVILYRIFDAEIVVVNVFYGGKDYASIMGGAQDDDL